MGLQIFIQLPERVIEEVVVGVRVAQTGEGRLKLFAAKKMALIGLNTPHFIEACDQGSACHFSVLVDNDIDADFRFEKHAKYSSRVTVTIVPEGPCFLFDGSGVARQNRMRLCGQFGIGGVSTKREGTACRPHGPET